MGMTEQEKRDKVMAGLECCKGECLEPSEGKCPYYPDTHGDRCFHMLISDALELLKAHESADSIPIDWLMNYAQLPTEFAISAWRKPKKEAEIKQAKSLDKPMSLDDALELLKAQEPIEPIHTDKYMRTEPITFEYKCAVCEVGLMRHWVCCPCCGKAVKWE